MISFRIIWQLVPRGRMAKDCTGGRTCHVLTRAALLCVALVTARWASAQDDPSGPRHCIPARAPLHSSQQPLAQLFATLVPARDSADAPAMYLATVLQEALLLFRAPDSMSKLSDGVMAVWLHADGRLTNARAGDTLLPTPLVAALSTALDSLSRRGGIGPVFPALGVDSVELRLIVHYADQRTPLSLPFLRVAIPQVYFEFQVEKPAMARAGNPSPVYPALLRESGTNGEVLAQFVVDRSGRAEIRTLKVLRASHGDFVKAVRDVLPQMRFHPAELGGCTVKQLVQLPFAFRTGQ